MYVIITVKQITIGKIKYQMQFKNYSQLSYTFMAVATILLYV